MEANKNKELKIKSFRVDEETFEKFKQIASSEFGNQGQCLDALINLYEMENSKTALIERKMEIESFQDYLNKINQLFVTSLQMSKDAESRVNDEFKRQISIKDTTIERMQIREKDLNDKLNNYKTKEKLMEEEIVELKKVNKSLELDKTTLSQLVSRNHDLLERSKRDLEELERMKLYEKENEELKEDLLKNNKSFLELENNNKKLYMELELSKKEVSYFKEKIDELKDEIISYRNIIEAVRNDHKKEIEMLEGKYSNIVKNEKERLLDEFNSKLELERRTKELVIKTLEQERDTLQMKLKEI